jgi:hypothetical protein
VGQDVSVVVVAKHTSDDALVKASRLAFADEPPANLVLLISRKGPPSVHRALSEFTAISVWADIEAGLDSFARQVSLLVDRCVVITMCDHACVGGWQIFDAGQARRAEWLSEDYTDAGIRGIETAFAVKLRPTADERGTFTESFMAEPKGLCVFSSAASLRKGKALSGQQVVDIMEHDLPDAELECLLWNGA